MKYQCTNCDINFNSEAEAKDCRDKNHKLIQVLEQKEINEANEKQKKSNEFVFQTRGKNFTVTQEILDHKIRTLRPQTFLQYNGWKIILVYLSTKFTINKGDLENDSTSYNFGNYAYFVISKPKNSISKRRIVVPYDNFTLVDKFKITVLPEWNDNRWHHSDLKMWLGESEPTNPIAVYQLHDKTVRRYIEFPNESEYTKFNLWNICTYCFELFPAFPYNDFTGTKRVGKSKCLEFQKLVCFNPIMSANISSSATFRSIEGLGATVLLDETEEFKNKKNENAQAVRNILLQGFLREQYAVRSDTSKERNFTPVQYNLYSPKSLAHINSFDDVLEDRCITQVNTRTLNPDIRNTWPSDKDPAFQTIRNLCYRLFLDYADEIYYLQDKARGLLEISGRELQLWTPIITLALFFEKHGISGLVNAIKSNIVESSEERQLLDEQESRDLRVLKFIDTVGIPLAQNREIIGKNPTGWIPIEKLYSELKSRSEEYEINTDFFSRTTLTQTLKKLGLKQKKQPQGISWLVIKNTVDDIKKRMGFYEGKDDSLDSFQSDLENTAEGAKSAISAQASTETKHKPATNAPFANHAHEIRNDINTDSISNSVSMQSTAISTIDQIAENAGAAAVSKEKFFCHTCNAGWFNVDECSLSSGNIFELHQKLGHNIEFKSNEDRI